MLWVLGGNGKRGLESKWQASTTVLVLAMLGYLGEGERDVAISGRPRRLMESDKFTQSLLRSRFFHCPQVEM